MAEESKSGNFVVGVSFHLILALLLPGAVATFFFVWFFGLEHLLKTTGGKELTLTTAVAFSLIFGLALTPWAFFVEAAIRKIRKSPTAQWSDWSTTILEAEKEHRVGWYFYQVWGQTIMHWNVACSVLLLSAIYAFRGHFVSKTLGFCGSLSDIDYKLLAAVFVVGFNFFASHRFSAWHEKNIEWLKSQSGGA